MFETLVGVVAGFIIATAVTWLDRKRRLKTHWSVIRAELELCRERAQTLLDDPKHSPLYRLPTWAHEVSFPVLLAEGVVTEDEALVLGRCFAQIQDLNRGLDQAADALAANDAAGILRESGRNQIKAKALLDEFYPPARAVVDAKIALRWWRY
jgi:hypothetical protein